MAGTNASRPCAAPFSLHMASAFLPVPSLFLHNIFVTFLIVLCNPVVSCRVVLARNAALHVSERSTGIALLVLISAESQPNLTDFYHHLPCICQSMMRPIVFILHRLRRYAEFNARSRIIYVSFLPTAAKVYSRHRKSTLKSSGIQMDVLYV